MKYVSILVAVMSMTGCLGNKSLAEGPAISSPAVKQELLERWNATVDQHPSADYDFHWPTFSEFPHPTFKGGTVAGYQTFGVVLLAFLEPNDNFDFVAGQRLFDTALPYALANGQSSEWTLRELVHDFAEGQPFAVDAETRAGLTQMETRIEQAK